MSAPYHEWFAVPGGRARLSVAGHILGSAHAEVEAGGRRVVFSGDVGRWDIPVLKNPEPPTGADLLLIESTYGGRRHEAKADPDGMLAAAVEKVVRRQGIMVIPAFSVGRAQEILYRLRGLEEAGRIPRLPVYLDSPMAIDATELYRRHHEEHDFEMDALEDAGKAPLRPTHLHMTRTVEESKRLNDLDPPAVILSASGMATGGRVVHHLKRRLPFRQNLVAFVGYQAEGTLGRSLVDGAQTVHIHGEEIEVRAEVTMLDAFSAHADEEELLRWVAEAAPRRIALIHGEPEGREALAEGPGRRVLRRGPAPGAGRHHRGVRSVPGWRRGTLGGRAGHVYGRPVRLRDPWPLGTARSPPSGEAKVPPGRAARLTRPAGPSPAARWRPGRTPTGWRRAARPLPPGAPGTGSTTAPGASPGAAARPG